MNLSNCKSITINNKDVAKIEINNKIAWQKVREKKRIIDGNAFNVLVKDINGSGSTVDTVDSSVTKFIFDYWNSSYETLLGNFTSGTDVSYLHDGSIRLFYVNSIVYVLSDYIIKTENAKSMFQKFSITEEIDFDNFDTTDCTSLELFMFESPSIYKQRGMEKFDTSNCTSMQNMLNKTAFNKIGQDNTCDLNLSGWDTRKVTTMRQMFRFCGATSIDISNFYTPLCVSFYAMFANCSNLVTLNMENVDMSLCDGSSGGNNSNAHNIFTQSNNLTNLVFGKNLGYGYASYFNHDFASINLSTSPLLTHDSLMSVINNVGQIGFTTNIIYIYMGQTNYSKVTAEEIAVATAKGWSVTSSSRS